MRRRRTVGWYREHPRAFDDAIGEWNLRELDRYERELDRCEAVDRDFEAWLEQIEPETDDA